MNFNEYQVKMRETAAYPDAGNNFIYPTLGLAGEAGEVVDKIKKLVRTKDTRSAKDISDADKLELKKELGDVLWYVSTLAAELGFELSDVAQTNVEKVFSRKERGVLHGSGDNR